MGTMNFEDELMKMKKPEITELKHESLLARAFVNARDKSVVTWWWLSIPLYITVMLLMKSYFKPGTGFISNLHEITKNGDLLSVLFFLLIPLLFILLNFISLLKIYMFSGSPEFTHFLKQVWYNVLMVILSLVVVLFYFI